MKNFRSIAIDGPAGAGKSDVSSSLAKKLNFIHVDTGALYRALAFYFLDNKINCENIPGELKNINIKLSFMCGIQAVLLNNIDVTRNLRNSEVSNFASKISSLNAVRNFLLNTQRSIAKNNNVIMDGRDIGTIVLPNADVKIFLTASIEERAKRRFEQYKPKQINCKYDDILISIKQRDNNDINRDIAPLRPAEDCMIYDSTNKSFDEVVTYLFEYIRGKIGFHL